MREPAAPKTPKLPFFVADVFLVATATVVFYQGPRPLTIGALALVVLCALAAAGVAILPFVLEYRALSRLAEADALTDMVSQVGEMETVADQIRHATAQWQGVQESAAKTAGAAEAIAGRMATEIKNFSEFMERASNSEKATLRLEVDKLRRAEAEWVQVLVGVLDHVYALYRGAVRSGQPSLVDQITGFQAACRDVVRRVGLVPFTAKPEDPFQPERHQCVEGNDKVPAGSRVGDTLATGFTYQGRMVRPALVNLSEAGAASTDSGLIEAPVAAGTDVPPAGGA